MDYWIKEKLRIRSGYTWIEMLIVLTLISVVAAAVIPTLAVSKRWQLERYATQLRSDIRFIQSMAMATGERHCIELIGNSGYTVKCSSDGKIIKTVPLNGLKKLTYNSSSKIEFTPKGTINTGRTITICSDTYECKLEVHPVTGKVDKFEITKTNAY